MQVGCPDVFAVGVTGNAMSMSESNSGMNHQPDAKPTAASKARRAADKATAPASRAAKNAVATTDEAASAAKAGAERSAEAAVRTVRTAAGSVEAGRQAIVASAGHVAATARTAWTVIAQRKLVAAGVGAGLTALSAASYAVGRRSGQRTYGPITRLTGGRI